MTQPTQITRKSIMTFLTNVLQEAAAVTEPGAIGAYSMRIASDEVEMRIATVRPVDPAVNLPAAEYLSVNMTEAQAEKYVEMWRTAGDTALETGTFLFDGLKAWGFAVAMSDVVITAEQAPEHPHSFCFTDGQIGVYMFLTPLVARPAAVEELAAAEEATQEAAE